MPRFRLLGDQPVDLYKPSGHGDSLRVEPGQTVDVPGSLVTSRPAPKKDEEPLPPLPEDAYIVVLNGEESAWPHALWQLDEDKPVKSKAKEN